MPPDNPPREVLGPTLIVGAGEFGGSLTELRLLLQELSADTGMAFVCTRQPEPEDGSRLAELLAPYTSMPVIEAEHGTTIEANAVYVAPPGGAISVRGAHLASRTASRDIGAAGAFDQLCESLARDYGSRAVGIVLSGSEGNGTGLREIRRGGGLTILQTNLDDEGREGAIEGIDAGELDLTLDTESIPRALERFARLPSEVRAARRELPEADSTQERGSSEHEQPSREPPLDEAVLARLAQALGDRGEAAVRTYKPDMIGRRVRRRMSLSGCESVDAYLDFLAEREGERGQLARDLLIGVTDFFRDAEAFRALHSLVVEPLVAATTPGEKLRIWVPACATGEEAYSIAMEFLDAAHAHGGELALQVFATDVYPEALEVARAGFYPDSIAETVGADRLEEHFIRTDDGRYQVRPALRDLVSFGVQDVTRDPPFSRMNLVSCRNLLIYFRPHVRDRVLRSLQFALDPGGYLVLGSSESAGADNEHLLTLSKKWRIYKKVGAPAQTALPASGRGPPASLSELEPTGETGGSAGHRPRTTDVQPRAAAPQSGIGDLARRAVMRVHVPPGIVVSETGDVLFMHGELRPYLRFPDGDARLDLTSLLAPRLATRARTALFKCRREGHTVVTYSSPDSESGSQTRITGALVPELGNGAVVLTFEEVEGLAPLPLPESESVAHAVVIDQLERELRGVQDQLHGTVAELETSNEQLRVANEESTSVNEELLAANQDLEATTEELRSVNEELTSVNRRLREKVEQIEMARDDLSNFFMSTRIATLFLDDELRIKRFTPAAAMLLDLDGAGVGVHVGDVEHELLGKDLIGEAARVLRDLSDAVQELQTPEDRWYMRRVLPYRTSHNRIEGVVVTLSDVTELRRATSRLALREHQQAVIARLGLEALEDADLQHFMDHAVREVRNTLDTDLCNVFELQPGGQVLLLRAGVGWPEELVWQASVPAGLDSQAGYTIKQGTPVTVDGLATERRFRASTLLLDQGIHSGGSCVIRTGDTPYGVLGAYTREPRAFSPEDTNFLQSAAAVIAAAVARDETRARLVLKNAAAEAFTDARELRHGLSRLYEAAARELGTVVGELWEPNEDGTHLVRTLVHAMPPFTEEGVEADLPASPTPLGEGFQGRVFDAAQAEWISSLQDSSQFRRVEEARRLGLLSGLALPITSGRTVLGVVAMFSQARLYAGDALLRSLESIGRSIGDFIQFLDVEGRRQQMERELRDSEARFRQVLLSSPVPTMVYDDSGAVLEVSDSWKALSGYTLAELPTIADWIRTAFEGRDEAGALTGRVWTDELATYQTEVDIRTKRAETRRLAISSVALDAARGGRRLRVVAAADVTDQRRSEEERSEANRQKDEFIAMLGHELRNPLAAVRSATELLQRARPDDSLIQRTQGILDRQTTHMARLLDGLLDLSRIVRGRISLDKRLLDLGALLRDAVRDYSVTMRDAGLELLVDVPPEPMWLHADPVRLSQVATNLLSNAIKFTPSPGTVTVRLAEVEGVAVMSVADTGNGIDPDLLPKLFQPFRQAHQAIDRSLGGLGLGLSLVKTLVELHEGTVEARSEGEGLGSEFIVRLPLTDHRPSEAESTTEEEKTLRILIIEDNEDAAESLREILEFEGHETAVAGGGSRGIELARKFDPDVVLCDLGLPDLNGFDVAVALREDPRTRDLYLVALSGYGRPEDKRRCEEVGFDTHLTKPVLMRDLEIVLARAGTPRPREHGPPMPRRRRGSPAGRR